MFCRPNFSSIGFIDMLFVQEYKSNHYIELGDKVNCILFNEIILCIHDCLVMVLMDPLLLNILVISKHIKTQRETTDNNINEIFL